MVLSIPIAFIVILVKDECVHQYYTSLSLLLKAARCGKPMCTEMVNTARIQFSGQPFKEDISVFNFLDARMDMSNSKIVG